MRYEDWDILLFARNWEVPLKEFKVACHVVQDAGKEAAEVTIPGLMCLRILAHARLFRPAHSLLLRAKFARRNAL